VDVYDPSLGTPAVQIHDLNPGIEPDGLFWTVALPEVGVEVDLEHGFASLKAAKVAIDDYGNIGNALLGGGPAPIPGHVSFTVEWVRAGDPFTVDNDDDPSLGGGFEAKFLPSAAQMEWTARVGDLKFDSDPLVTSSSVFAEIGKEANGVFKT
jgi:hypothetical protein